MRISFSGNKKVISFASEKEMNKLLEKMAQAEKRTKSEIIREALNMYVSRNVNDKELIYSSINNLKRSLEYTDKKLELFFNLWFFSLTSTFASMPAISDKSKEEQLMIMKKANKRKTAMFESFKNNMKKSPSIFEAMLADFIEHENTDE